VLALNNKNNLISNVEVAFAADSGGIAVTSALTNSSGAATATLSTAGDSTPRTITVTATSGSLTATVKVQVVATSSATTTAVSQLTLSASTPSILTDGSTSATISALARDASNNVLAGVPVTFVASSGAIQVTQGTTDATGTALAVLTAGDNTTPRTITVTGSTASLSSTVQIGVVAPSTPTTPVYTMGNGSGTGFVAGAISVGTSTLSAGGTSALGVTIVDQTDTLYTGAAVSVTFNSPCIASGKAAILNSADTQVTSVTTSSGAVNVTYEALGCSGTDTVTATATVGSQNISATASLTIAAATVGSIQFESATPTSIGLKGTGLNETSTLVFKVTNSSGGPASGVQVKFALDTTVGGLSVSPNSADTPAYATSAADGTVQAVVSSGTVHTVVRVTATTVNTPTAISTQSSQLTVTTGLPASGAFSIAVGVANYGSSSSTLACPNVEAYSIDGVAVPVTVRLADSNNNPVPDGTAVAFVTNGGHIQGSCTTPLSSSGDGACKVTWTSANPRPALTSDTPDLLAAGRATVLATTIGEESFTDVNGTGFWQTGDAFSNLGEPYLDANENGQYDSGEYFLNYDQQSTWQAGSGSYVGITCNGTTAGSTCSTSTLAIGASHLIIMSTSAANPVVASVSGFTNSGSASAPQLSIGPAATGTIVITVKDTNGNPMAAGTTVGYSLAPTTLGTATAIGPTTEGCASDVGGTPFEVQFSPTGTAGSGTLTVTITSPNGTATAFVIPITVT
jgi:hypothetical protein